MAHQILYCYELNIKQGIPADFKAFFQLIPSVLLSVRAPHDVRGILRYQG